MKKKNNVSNKETTYTLESIIQKSIESPIVKVEREKFLKTSLMPYYKEDVVNLAIAKKPAYAGIPRKTIQKIAKESVKLEAKHVANVSIVLNCSGGIISILMGAADLEQYFIHTLIIMQKLAYLYGFPEFKFSENEINDKLMNQILIFLGIMFGVKQANTYLQIITESVTKKTAKELQKKALSKTFVFSTTKRLAKKIGFKLTKSTFINGCVKFIPLIGALISGTLTYHSFKKSAQNLEKKLSSLNLSDPNFYKDN